MLIFQWFANSRIVREFPPFSFKVRIATLTRNQFEGNLTRVRIPPAPPKPFFFKSLHFNGVGSFSLPTRGLDAGELFAGLIVLF